MKIKDWTGPYCKIEDKEFLIYWQHIPVICEYCGKEWNSNPHCNYFCPYCTYKRACEEVTKHLPNIIDRIFSTEYGSLNLKKILDVNK